MSDSDDCYGPPLPPGMQSGKTEDEEASSDDQYGPVLPSSSQERSNQGSNTSSADQKDRLNKGKNVIGPLLPSNLGKTSHYSSDSESDSSSSSDTDSDDSSTRRRKKLKRSHSGEIGGEQSVIGPVVPSHLRQASSTVRHVGERSIGPVLPSGLAGSGETTVDSESDEDIIGPNVGLQATEEDLSAVKEFESRSQRMKEKLTCSSKTDDTEVQVPKKRESWMTELPEGMGAGFGLGSRQFRTKEAPEIDSSWTEAPHEKGQKHKEGKKKKKDKNEHFQSAQDKKAAREIEEYNKKHRPESLLEMHKKEQKKKKKKEKKKNKNKPQERRPFDRDIDLKVNRFDDAMKKAYIKKSQELTSRFKSGGTGTSFL